MVCSSDLPPPPPPNTHRRPTQEKLNRSGPVWKRDVWRGVNRKNVQGVESQQPLLHTSAVTEVLASLGNKITQPWSLKNKIDGSGPVQGFDTYI